MAVVAAMLLAAACSDGSSGSGGGTTTTAPASTTAPTSSTAPTPTVPTTTEAPAETPVPIGGDETHVVVSFVADDPGARAPDAVLDEVGDGGLLFVSELPDGTPGMEVTLTDASLDVIATVEFDAIPLVVDIGWPDIGVVRFPGSPGLALIDGVTGEVQRLVDPDGSPVDVFPDGTGRRFVPARAATDAATPFVLDLADGELRPIAGTRRSGPPQISGDGAWAVAVAEWTDLGAAALDLVRPDSPDVARVTYVAEDGYVIESWFFGPQGALWFSVRDVVDGSSRLVARVEEAGGAPEAVLAWAGREGHRLLAEIGPDRLLVEERSSFDHLVIGTDGTVVARVPRPRELPGGLGDALAYVDSNDLLLVDVRDGASDSFVAVGGPTPSEVDRRAEGQYWLADGFTVGEIGLFRLDLGTGEFHDYRDVAPIELDGGEHFFSFDPDRFHPSGRAVVVYQGTFRSALVALMEDGSGVTYPLTEGERVIDVTLSPSGEHAVVVAGVREIDNRTSVAFVVPSDLSSGPVGDGRLEGQKLAVWLPGAT